MSKFPGFVGGSYTLQSVNADCQRTLNWYPSIVESGTGKNKMVFDPSPGLAVFANLAGMVNIRNQFTVQASSRTFAIAETLSNQFLWEIFSDGTSTNRGQLGRSGGQGSMTANNANQLLAVSDGRLFLFNLTANTLTEISTTDGSALQGPVSFVDFGDSFFIALLANSQKFQISAPLDGSSWDPADIFQVEVFADNVPAIMVDHRELWLWGQTKSVVYADTGDPTNPLQPIPGAFIEQGIVAKYSAVKLDNSVFWIGGDERGAGIAWRAQGYVPARVSNHAVEFAWQSYPTISDAIGYSYQDQGHSFWHIFFPTANKSWRFDVATGMWHEVAFLDGTAHRSRCHTFAFGKHLVGDWNSGNIYQMSITLTDDAGTAIRRVRRAPHISDELRWFYHSQIQIDVEPGLGPQPPLLDGNGNPRGPQVMLRWSDDGGHTWSSEYMLNCGQTGQFKTRVRRMRLGRSRDRVYEVSTSDAIQWRLIDAYLDVN